MSSARSNARRLLAKVLAIWRDNVVYCRYRCSFSDV